MHALTSPKNPFIMMSSLAPSCTLTVDREKSSCETGCNSGSVATCEHTLVNNLAVRSLISLYRIEGNPPLGQDKACSMEKDVPQAQCVGVRSGSQP